MKRIAARVLLPLAAAAAFAPLAGGVAGAATLVPAGNPVIWALPGLDVGGLLGPVGQPLELLAPVYGLITAIS